MGPEPATTPGLQSESGQGSGLSHARRMSHLAATGITIYLENDGRESYLPYVRADTQQSGGSLITPRTD
jgi:hypothetical protein